MIEIQKETISAEEKTFRTKTGFCHVLPDKIVLTRNGILGSVAAVTVGNTISRTRVIQGILTLGLFYAAFYSYQNRNLFMFHRPFLFLALAGYLIFNIVRSFKLSATPIIERAQISQVVFHEALRGLIRPYFEVFFENEKGRIKKRLILLPGSLMDSQRAETEKALQIMKEEGIIKM